MEVSLDEIYNYFFWNELNVLNHDCTTYDDTFHHARENLFASVVNAVLPVRGALLFLTVVFRPLPCLQLSPPPEQRNKRA